MTFDQLQRMVALTCGNLKNSHPLFKWVTGDAGTSTPSVINQAANRLVRMMPERFPELRATWTVGPTVTGNNQIVLPGDIIVLYDVACAHSPTLPNWNTQKTFPMEPIDAGGFDLLDKSASDFPKLFHKIGKVVKVWPTPDASHIDYTRWYGRMEETALVNPGDAFFMHADFHAAVVKLSASLIEQMRGNDDRAKELLGAMKDELSAMRDLEAEENLGMNDAMTVEGAPTRSSVHG